jgi:DNA mismatch endonuclease (patch repair protein)
MRAVKSKNTSPEIIVRKLIYSLGFRFRLHSSKLPGKPDIVFSLRKKVIFVNGCFWHGHRCKRGNRIPSNNQEYWKNKIQKNKNRDTKNLALIDEAGWKALVLWECEIRDKERLKTKIINFLAD